MCIYVYICIYTYMCAWACISVYLGACPYLSIYLSIYYLVYNYFVHKTNFRPTPVSVFTPFWVFVNYWYILDLRSSLMSDEIDGKSFDANKFGMPSTFQGEYTWRMVSYCLRVENSRHIIAFLFWYVKNIQFHLLSQLNCLYSFSYDQFVLNRLSINPSSRQYLWICNWDDIPSLL